MNKGALKAIIAKTKIGTKPPKRHRAKRKPRKMNLLAPQFLRQPPPLSPDDALSAELDVLAQRIGQSEADALRARFARRRPAHTGRPVDDGPPTGRVTDPI